MDSKKPKTPTEPIRMDDVWNNFKVDYLPFAEWISNPDADEYFMIIHFEEDVPTPYVNKWNREQFKMKVRQNEMTKILSGGKRLFQFIREFCIKENKLPSVFDEIQITRFGNGFDTNYKISIPLKQSHL